MGDTAPGSDNGGGDRYRNSVLRHAAIASLSGIKPLRQRVSERDIRATLVADHLLPGGKDEQESIGSGIHDGEWSIQSIVCVPRRKMEGGNPGAVILLRMHGVQRGADIRVGAVPDYREELGAIDGATGPRAGRHNRAAAGGGGARRRRGFRLVWRVRAGDRVLRLVRRVPAGDER